MSGSNVKNAKTTEVEEILDYVARASGLRFEFEETGWLMIEQSVDSKSFSFHSSEVTEVLARADGDGSPFIQVNFQDGRKVLLTDTLVGFKPAETFGLDMAKIPKVVTTPDLMSVFDAISESLSHDKANEYEVEILKKVFQSILSGAEAIGFKLEAERRILDRLSSTKLRASA